MAWYDSLADSFTKDGGLGSTALSMLGNVGGNILNNISSGKSWSGQPKGGAIQAIPTQPYTGGFQGLAQAMPTFMNQGAQLAGQYAGNAIGGPWGHVVQQGIGNAGQALGNASQQWQQGGPMNWGDVERSANIPNYANQIAQTGANQINTGQNPWGKVGADAIRDVGNTVGTVAAKPEETMSTLTSLLSKLMSQSAQTGVNQIAPGNNLIQPPTTVGTLPPEIQSVIKPPVSDMPGADMYNALLG